MLHCKQSTFCLSQSRAVWTIKKNRTCKRRFRGKSTIFLRNLNNGQLQLHRDMLRGLLLDRQLSYCMPKRVTYLNLLYELYVVEKLFQLCLHCNLLLLPGACVSKGCVLQTSSVRTEKCKQVRTPAHGDNSLVAASEHESNLQLQQSV